MRIPESQSLRMHARGDRRASGGTGASPRVAFLLALILVLAVGLRLLSFHGYAGSDDGSYAQLAHELASGKFRVGEYVGPPVFPLRVGVFAPVAGLFRLFGVSEVTTIAYPFALSLLMLVLLYHTGRLLFGVTAGLLAAALLAVVPIASRSATILMPDLPAAFWGNLGMFMLLLGLRQERAGRKLLFGTLCGLALGISWLCKETVGYLFPFVLLAAFWGVRRSRSQLLVGFSLMASAAAVVVAEGLAYWYLTADPLHRLHEMHRNYTYNSTWFFAEGSRFGWAPGEYHIALVKRLFRDGPYTLLASPSFGGLTAVALLAVAYAAYHRRESFAFAGAWFVWLLLVFNFGSCSLREYQPLVLFDKYAYPLLFPAALLSGGLLAHLIAERAADGEAPARLHSERAFWGYALAGLIGVACALPTAENMWSGRKSEAERMAARCISPRDPLYTDSRTLRVLEFFWSFPRQLAAVDFQNLAVDEIPAGAYVLVNRDKLRLLENYYQYGVPAFCREAPPEWEVVTAGGGMVLYRTPSDDVAQAEAPDTPSEQ